MDPLINPQTTQPQIVVHLNGEHVFYRFERCVITVGRDPRSRIRIDDDSVSVNHLEIHPTDTGYDLIDLGSTNGTFLNQRPVSVTPINHGDMICVGGHVYLEFSLEQASDDRADSVEAAGLALSR